MMIVLWSVVVDRIHENDYVKFRMEHLYKYNERCSFHYLPPSPVHHPIEYIHICTLSTPIPLLLAGWLEYFNISWPVWYNEPERIYYHREEVRREGEVEP